MVITAKANTWIDSCGHSVGILPESDQGDKAAGASCVPPASMNPSGRRGSAGPPLPPLPRKWASGTAAARHRSASSKRRSPRKRRKSSRSKRYGRPSSNLRTSFRTSTAKTSRSRPNVFGLVCSKTNRPLCALPESLRVMMSNHFSTPPASNRFSSRSPSTYTPPTGGGPFLSLQVCMRPGRRKMRRKMNSRRPRALALSPCRRLVAVASRLCLSPRRRKMFSR